MQAFDKHGGRTAGSYAAGLTSLAGLLHAQGEDGLALELYQKAARHIKATEGETLEYAAACQHLSWIYRQTGRRAQALDALMTADRVYETILGCEHERTQAVADDLRRLRRQTASAGGKVGAQG